MNASFLPSLPAGVQAAALTDLSFVTANGVDAVPFLHGQLTQDVQGLAPDAARPAAYCTAKGRILGSLLVWRDSGDGVQALLPASTAAGVVKRLRMFVLRAKVVLADAAAGIAGVWADAPDAVAALAAQVPGLPTSAWQRLTTPEGTTWIAAPCADTGPAGRWWVIAPGAAVEPTPQALASWHAQDIAAGLPWVEAAAQELFTPQMVNLDLLGGVSFTKGCYPGQEIVARSHYLGKQKRRMLHGHVDAIGAVAGQDVFDAVRGGEPIGRVVSAAVLGTAASLLFEAPAEAATQADLRLGALDGPAIRLADLPYPLGTPA
ncbi:folate-binding protein YgfZ [Achromobacter sp. GG226]|uniref:CAF17-like 4Fe-4S cluster assembly/insertion protein YgfZ n=1 Tax=Verticiella alkaliphila TaxID=2779529 RepID=UPI001C0D1DD3|nr:folate-binding protein [Verticiella sp. GG226]MBU4610224.1 folate-binding protein YgfZ [Verticiella sp. GG226]